MANTTISPNMNLPIPIPGVTPGSVEWAQDIVADMNAIDSHNHTNGQGVKIPPAGLNINADLPFNINNATLVKSVRFSPLAANLAAAADVGCLYEVSADLWYNDGSGNQVRITQGGSVTGSAGTITGLPSGTASASFAAGTFTFQSATNTPATLSVGPLVIGTQTASPKTVTIAPNGSQPANYSLTLPVDLPSAGTTAFFSVDNTGVMGTVSATGTGQLVRTASPNLTTPAFIGVPTGTVTGGSFSTTSSGDGGAVSGSFSYIRTGNRVVVYGRLALNTDGTGRSVIAVSLPIAPTSNFTNTYDVVGVGSTNSADFGITTTSVFVVANTGAKNALIVTKISAASSSVLTNISLTYSCS